MQVSLRVARHGMLNILEVIENIDSERFSFLNLIRCYPVGVEYGKQRIYYNKQRSTYEDALSFCESVSLQLVTVMDAGKLQVIEGQR